jgi:outer membrane receptor protein involved in Fe transport
MKLRLNPIVAVLAASPFMALPQTADAGRNRGDRARSPLQRSSVIKLGETELAPMRSSTSDTASLLRDIPGVSLYGAGGVSSLPSIHGLADDRLRIKLDGMDLIASCPNHMNPALSYIDPSNVETLKVYAGITPVSSGGDAIGGTIIAESRAAEFAAPGQAAITKGEAGVFYRSNNNARGANVSATYANERFNISYSGATSQADNYTAGDDFKTYDFTGRIGHTLPRDEVGSTAYETRNHTLGLAFKNDAHLFEAKLGVQDMPFQLYPNQRMDMLNNEQNSLNLRYLGKLDWGSLEARAYHEQVDHFMDFGADKRFWYGNGVPPIGSGGPTASMAALAARSAPPVPPACRCTPKAKRRDSASRRMSPSPRKTACASAAKFSNTDSTTGGHRQALACGRALSGTSRMANVIAPRCLANGKRASDPTG